MSQHYPNPHDVIADGPKWPTKSLKRIIERDGLIVPILVTVNEDGKFVAAGYNQAERVLACRELSFPTILVETEWNPEDVW
jgi:uncharacterized protein (UPF0264 family)